MHRKWEKLGICCRDNLGEFSVGRIFGRAGAGGWVVRRGGEAGRRSGVGWRGAGPAAVPPKRAGRVCPPGGRAACGPYACGFCRGGEGVQKLPPFPGAIWQVYAVIPA